MRIDAEKCAYAALLLALGALTSSAGCGADSKAPAATVALNDASAAPTASEPGCTFEADLLQTTDACRREWSCGDGGLVGLGCVVGDGGAACACVRGEAVLDAGTASPTVCTDPNGLTQAALAICGWIVP